MKQAFWAYGIVSFGVIIVVVMLLIQRMTITTEENYYLEKEILESSMIDAVDYGTYRTTGKIVMSKEKFVEVFIRRFAESVTNNKTYQLNFYDIKEEPPKATVRIRTSSGTTELNSDSFDINLDTTLSGILETIYGTRKENSVINGNSVVEYTISFDKNCSGATGGQSASVKVTYGGSLPKISNTAPQCGNKVFEGWSDNKDYYKGELYYYANGIAIKDRYDVKRNITLYGRWSDVSTTPVTPSSGCTVTYHANGGTGTISSQQVTCGNMVKLATNSFKRDNTKFVNWNTKADGSGTSYNSQSVITLKSNLDLYAQWECTITYEKNGGTGTMNEQKATCGRKVKLTANSFKNGSTKFVSWNTKTNGSGTAYKDKAEITLNNSITLYAQWGKACKVTFKANGGTGTMSTQTVTCGEKLELAPNSFERTNATFAGWNTKDNRSGTTYNDKQTITLKKDLTLYAQWDCTITYHANGGTGTMDSQKYRCGKKVELKANTYKRDNYKFNSWNTKADGSGTKYKNKKSITLNNSIDLYAQWKSTSSSSGK